MAPDARHPFGTGNCCVFFANHTYLEAITVMDRTTADMAAAEGNVFVRRIKRFTERRGEGLAMVALESADAEGDRAAFEKAGLAVGEAFRFARLAKCADGSEREIGVALAHAESPDVLDAGFFACQHLDRDALFDAAYLDHPNGATGIVAVTAVAESPEDFTAFLGAAVGRKKLVAGSAGIEARGKRSSFLVLTPDGFRERYGVAPPNPRRGLVFAALELRVLEIERALGYAGREALRRGDRIIVPPAPGLNAVMVFRSANG